MIAELETADVRKYTERFTDAKQMEIVLVGGVLKNICGTKNSRYAKIHRMIYGRETAGNHSRKRCIEAYLRNWNRRQKA